MARTSARLTQAEMSAYDQYAIDNGLILEGTVGRQNGDLLGGFIVNQMNADITPQTLEAAVKHLRDRLIWKPQDQLDYEKLFASLSQTDQNAFLAWKNPSRLIASYRNRYRLLRFLKDRRMAVNDSNLQIAIANLGIALEFTPVPSTTSETGYGRHSKGSRSFAPKSETNRSVTDTVKDHSKGPAEAKPKETSISADEARWRQMAEGLRGNRHSLNDAIRRAFVHDGNGNVDWRQTYQARLRMAEGRGGSI